MMYFRWFLFLLANIVMLILATILAPILPLFADQNRWLPHWLWWFQTPKSPISGNSDWRYNRRHWVHDRDVDSNKFKAWANEVSWLVRNPSYGFDTGPISFKTGDLAAVKLYGDKETTNQHAGFLYRTLTNPDGTRAWQLFYVHHWNGSHCLRINLGWKLWDYAQEARLLQFACSISPWKQYL